MSVTQGQKNYWQALGKFVSAYAELETALFLALRETAKVPAPTAKALLSGVRADAATKLISRLLEVKKKPKALRDEFQYACAQFGHINDARNLILHYGAEFTSDLELVASNAIIALTPDRVKKLPVSVQILEDMSADIMKIRGHLIPLIIPAKIPLPEPLALALERNKQHQWRYKPPSPPPQKSKGLSNAPKRRNRRGASRQ